MATKYNQLYNNPQLNRAFSNIARTLIGSAQDDAAVSLSNLRNAQTKEQNLRNQNMMDLRNTIEPTSQLLGSQIARTITGNPNVGINESGTGFVDGGNMSMPLSNNLDRNTNMSNQFSSAGRAMLGDLDFTPNQFTGALKNLNQTQTDNLARSLILSDDPKKQRQGFILSGNNPGKYFKEGTAEKEIANKLEADLFSSTKKLEGTKYSADQKLKGVKDKNIVTERIGLDKNEKTREVGLDKNEKTKEVGLDKNKKDFEAKKEKNQIDKMYKEGLLKVKEKEKKGMPKIKQVQDAVLNLYESNAAYEDFGAKFRSRITDIFLKQVFKDLNNGVPVDQNRPNGEKRQITFTEAFQRNSRMIADGIVEIGSGFFSSNFKFPLYFYNSFKRNFNSMGEEEVKRKIIRDFGYDSDQAKAVINQIKSELN